MAILQESHRWHVYPPAQTFDPATFFSNLRSRLGKSGCILAGFDFPIGLPYQYAAKTGLNDFLTLLPLLGHAEWSRFYDPAEIPDQISLYRPFYPLKSGNARRSHLEQGLGLSFSQLFRLCEIAHENRRAACPLFWTLGGQQVGKAAIHGWKHLLIPALEQPQLRLKLWPFSGSFSDLCLPGNIIVVETYPAEYYSHLGIFQPGDRMSKRKQSGRKYYTEKLISLSDRLNLDLDPGVISAIQDGFGDFLDSEDRFDALVGLYGMINVVQANHPNGEPVPSRIAKIEGWIFGQAQLER